MREGFSAWVCNYCQLQLEMFNAFVMKAQQSNETFERVASEIEVLDEVMEEDEMQFSKVKCDEDWGIEESFEGLEEHEDSCDSNFNSSAQKVEEIWIEQEDPSCIEPAENADKADDGELELFCLLNSDPISFSFSFARN